MSFCPNCGAYIPVGEKKCPACGMKTGEVYTGGTAAQTAPENDTQTPFGAQGEAKAGTYQTSGTYSAPKKEQGWEPWKQVGDGTPHTQYASQSSDPGYEDKKLNVLSYVGPLFIVPLLLRKGDTFAKYHANQGCVLFILELILGNFFGGLLGVAGTLFCLFCIVLGAKNVAQGIMAPLPLIGKIRILK